MTTILYIEDDPQQVELVGLLLAKEGIEVMGAREGESGAQLAFQHQPALVLMDINLPGASGVEVAQYFRSVPELAHIPIIALTSAMKQNIIQPHLGTLFQGYIPKPIMRPDLLNAVRQALTAIQN
jgi:CheY-like chemotaxis protein